MSCQSLLAFARVKTKGLNLFSKEDFEAFVEEDNVISFNAFLVCGSAEVQLVLVVKALKIIQFDVSFLSDCIAFCGLNPVSQTHDVVKRYIFETSCPATDNTCGDLPSPC